MQATKQKQNQHSKCFVWFQFVVIFSVFLKEDWTNRILECWHKGQFLNRIISSRIVFFGLQFVVTLGQINQNFMSAFDDKLDFLLGEATKLGLNVNVGLFTKVAKGLGPSLYSDDAALVSSSDPEELNRVKTSFLNGKLGITDEQAIDDAMAEVIAQFGSSNRNKYRAIFYYLLVEKFGKASVYSD